MKIRKHDFSKALHLALKGRPLLLRFYAEEAKKSRGRRTSKASPAGNPWSFFRHAMHQACMTGDIASLRALVASGGCDINEKDRDGLTPLHNTLQGFGPDCDKCCEFLLSIGADASLTQADGQTPLCMAQLLDMDSDRENMYQARLRSFERVSAALFYYDPTLGLALADSTIKQMLDFASRDD